MLLDAGLGKSEPVQFALLKTMASTAPLETVAGQRRAAADRQRRGRGDPPRLVLVKERPSKLTPSNRTRVLVPGWSMRTKLSGVRAAPE